MENVVTSNNGPEVSYSEVELTEEQLKERRRYLDNCKLQKDDTDIQLEELEEQLDLKLPSRILDESIEEMEQNIKEGMVTRSRNGLEIKEKATAADIDLMKGKVKSMKKMKKLDIPMRDLRLRISNLRASKQQIDAPDMQILKLEREIKKKKATVPSTRLRPTGVL
jgi:hypothetical protein